MKLLFTGASGFLGINTLKILQNQYSTTTIGLNSNNNIQFDISQGVPSIDSKFDIILHAAGKAHSIPKNEGEKKDFFDVNLQGTKNLCAAIEKSGTPKSFIFISTVAVYGVESGENITEDFPLNGNTPYALSKILAEQFLLEWCQKHNVILSIIRPSLIAGPNPPGNLGAMVSGIKSGKYLSISSGNARKSVLMVQDIAILLPLLANKGGVYNVCDSEHPTFRNLELVISEQLGKHLPPSIPLILAKCFALIGDFLGNKAPINSNKLEKITKSLTFSNKKATIELGWTPLCVLKNFKIH
ncbi:MAG: NAD-dependent epimerase/dehydratase family protein [Ferruginibacter sp.]